MADAKQGKPSRPAETPPASAKDDTPHWTRTAGGIASLIAAAVFVFGVGSFTDLKDRVTGKTAKHSVALQLQVNGITASCLSVGGGAAAPNKITLSWLNQMLNARVTFAARWAQSDTPGLTDAEQSDMVAARTQFRAATGFWAALTHDFKAGDVSAYDAHLGEYFQAMAGYLATLHRYGLHGDCPVAWSPPPPWQS
jgi:hypothetical protein